MGAQGGVRERVKIIVLGNSGVGKTSLLRRWVHDEWCDGGSATIGMDFYRKTILMEGLPIEFNIWDTAGAERFRSLSRSYVRDSQGVIIVFSLIDNASFRALAEWHSMVVAEAGQGVAMVIVGNMCDVAPLRREVSFEEAQRVADRLHLEYFEVSALTREGVDAMGQSIMLSAYSARRGAGGKRRGPQAGGGEGRCC